MKNICILAPYGFSAATTFSLYEIFRVSNLVKNPSSFQVRILAPEKIMNSYLGTSHVFTDKLPGKIDVLIITGCAGENKDTVFSNLKKSSQWVRGMIKKARASGALICSSCSGSYFIAEEGLLKNKTATTAWWMLPEFSELFPEVSWNTEEILIPNGKIITAGGSMSALELSAELMGRMASTVTRVQTDKILVLPTRRKNQKAYRITAMGDHPDIKKGYKFISENIKTCSVEDLVKHLGMSHRTLHRFCMKHLSMAPFQWIKDIRLQYAQRLLDQTQKPTSDIASDVGYEDTTSFIRSFKNSYGMSPAKYREFSLDLT